MKNTLCFFFGLLFFFNCSYESESEGTVESEASTIIKEITNTSEEDIIEPKNIDSTSKLLIESGVKNLIQLITNNKKKEIGEMIDFPLDYPSSYAFGFNEDDSLPVMINKEEYIDNFSKFFRKPFLDTLKVRPNSYEIYNHSGKIRFHIRANTFDPANNEREWGIECSHRIYGYLVDSTIRISGFGLLCGGIM